MIDAEHISLFVGTAASVWVVGFTFGKAIAWMRHIRTAA